MILLALAKTERIRGHSSINTQCTAIFIHSLATTNYPTSPRRNSLPHPSHQYSGKTQRLFINNTKIFKDKSSTPENIQRLFRLQNCLSRKSLNSRKNSKIFQQQQQQQSSAATSSSNQQQQLAKATSSSNHQQQPAKATSSSNQQ